MKICFFPIFSDAEALTDHFYRLHWYLLPFKDAITEIVIPVESKSLKPGACPDFLDQSLTDMVGNLPVKFVPMAPEGFGEQIESADVVLKWNVGTDAEKAFRTALADKPSLRIDHERVRYAGSMYLKFRVEFDDMLGRLGGRYLTHAKSHYPRIKERCASDVCYVFGTGPGLADASEHDFSDGVCIACNSMVKNTELLDRLQPPLIVVGDPIFHAGPSSYAAAFRKELVKALDRYEADLIVPMRDYHIYAEHLPKRFMDRIVPVPFKHGTAPNFELEQAFHVTTTANVLTLFLLPLAADFSDDIRVFGCDGRPLEENDYFWGHDKASQFNDEMDDIQKAHPGFFDIDYDDYYAEHCQTLETWAASLEGAGKRITNHTFSYIPALAKRSANASGRFGIRVLEPPEVDESDLVSIVMPAFNAVGFIELAVASVLGQTYPTWELLIVEDGSTDDTLKVAEGFAAKDNRIKVFRNPGKYQAAARNHAMDQAEGKYLCFLDSDDIMHPNGLLARVQALQENKGVKLVHGIVSRISETGQDLRSPLAKMGPVSFRDMHANPFHINGIMGETHLFDKHRLRYHVPSGEDWMMMARILRMGHKSMYVPEEVAAWRYHPASATQRGMDEHEAVLEQTLNWVYSVCDPDDSNAENLHGLSKPPLLDVKLNRKTSVLLWRILTGDLEGTREMVHHPQLQKYFAKQSAQSWTNLARAAGLRFFRVPHDELPAIGDTVLRDMAEILVVSGIKSRIPDLFYGFSRAFGLPTYYRRTSSTQNRPFLECRREDGATLNESELLLQLIGPHDPATMTHIGLGSEDTTLLKPFRKLGWRVEHLGKGAAETGSGDGLGTSIEPRSITGAVFKQMLEDKDIPNASVLRLDALGSEHAVLRSLPWNRASPDIVHCQFYDEGMSANRLGVLDIAELLESRRYRVYVSEWFAPQTREEAPNTAWRRLVPYYSGVDIPPFAWGRLLAFKEDPGFEAIKTAFGGHVSTGRNAKAGVSQSVAGE
ncbi:MAG: glycosyltransferase [Pseudomonadota bacterium]